MYKNLGYIVYRTVLEYYSGDPDEDAYGNVIVLISMRISSFIFYFLPRLSFLNGYTIKLYLEFRNKIIYYINCFFCEIHFINYYSVIRVTLFLNDN